MLQKVMAEIKKRFLKLPQDLLQYHYHRARNMGVKVGKECRLFSSNFGSEGYLVKIGDHVTITDGVQFITHDGGIWIFRGEDPEADVFGRITIGNNVFIGVNTLILPGVCLGDNVVVGAGSVVTKSFGNNVVIAGNPAKMVCSAGEYRDKLWPMRISTKSIPDSDKLAVINQYPERIVVK